jgi:hypothetical protein
MLALVVDGVKLADLQIQLLTVDVRETWAGAWKAAILLAVAATALLAALPVAMFGIAEWLHESAGLSMQVALLLVAGVVLVTAAGLLVWSGKRLAVAIQPLRRSADELRANLTWMRSVIHDETVETPPVL